MAKVIQIEVPDWVDEKTVNKLKEVLLEKILDDIEKDYVDVKLYNLYYALKYPKTKNAELKDELKIFEELRKKE